jgi:hypothetical protein
MASGALHCCSRRSGWSRSSSALDCPIGVEPDGLIQTVIPMKNW